jgi:hypothetical protein
MASQVASEPNPLIIYEQFDSYPFDMDPIFQVGFVSMPIKKLVLNVRTPLIVRMKRS